MNDVDEFLNEVLRRAMAELQSNPIPVYTFAFYHDHESSAVSVCIDTEDSSRELVRKSNQWSMRYFSEHIAEGKWDDACLFQANVGRSLSLGDFACVNLARTELPLGINVDQSLSLAMVKAVIAYQRELLAHAQNPEDVVFCCSSPESEVGLTWSPIADA